jgi:hypothetical protein
MKIQTSPPSTDPAEGLGVQKMGAERRSLSVQIASARLQRLRTQNKNLDLDYRAKAGGYVLLEDIKRQVLAANVSVKNQVLAVIENSHLTREDKIVLKRNMIQALNDLAYERTRTPPDPE